MTYLQQIEAAVNAKRELRRLYCEERETIGKEKATAKFLTRQTTACQLAGTTSA